MKRIREVYPVGQVAHLWAHQTQASARNGGRRNNFYFKGDTIYSYGSHFPIARHVKNKRGESAVLFTTKSYSSTTSGHKSLVRGSISHLQNVFEVDCVTLTPDKSTLNDYAERIAGILQKAYRARQNKKWLLESAQALINDANAFSKFFGLRKQFKSPKDFDKLVQAADKAHKQNLLREREAEKQREIQRAERQRERMEQVEKWVAGETDNLPFMEYGDETRLRVKGNELQTSKRAIVPLAHAKRAFKLVQSCHDNERSWQTNGHTCHVGAFQINSIDTQGNVKAGCHNIAWGEIERIAKLQGWIK